EPRPGFTRHVTRVDLADASGPEQCTFDHVDLPSSWAHAFALCLAHACALPLWRTIAPALWYSMLPEPCRTKGDHPASPSLALPWKTTPALPTAGASMSSASVVSPSISTRSRSARDSKMSRASRNTSEDRRPIPPSAALAWG